MHVWTFILLLTQKNKCNCTYNIKYMYHINNYLHTDAKCEACTHTVTHTSLYNTSENMLLGWAEQNLCSVTIHVYLYNYMKVQVHTETWRKLYKARQCMFYKRKSMTWSRRVTKQPTEHRNSSWLLPKKPDEITPYSTKADHHLFTYK